MGAIWIFEDLQNVAKDPLPLFLLQLLVTLVMTRAVGKVLSYVKQPLVVGEMIGGILLGPSVLGNIPGYTDWLWPASSLGTFNVVANVGLIFFMFALGLELDFRDFQGIYKTVVPISVLGIAFPFAIGVGLSYWVYDYNFPFASNTDRTAFTIFFGVSISFTAFPVLAAVITDAKMLKTPIGILSLAAASLGDLLGWCVLAISTAFAAKGSATDGGYVFAMALAFSVIALLVVGPLFRRLVAYASNDGKSPTSPFIDFLYFCLVILCSFAFEVISVHAFFGAFLAGILAPKSGHPAAATADRMPERLELLTKELLLPLFFANSGIKTDIGQMTEASDWGYFAVILVVSVLVKVIPGTAITKLTTSRDWRFCVMVGLLMNTRGLVELIALNVGLQTGVIGQKLFTILTLMAVLTTCMTGPCLYLFYGRQKPSDAADEEAVPPNEMAQVDRVSLRGPVQLESLAEPAADDAAAGTEDTTNSNETDQSQ